MSAGGIDDIFATYIGFVSPNASSTAESLTWVAAVGQFWIIGYLLTAAALEKAMCASTSDRTFRRAARVTRG